MRKGKLLIFCAPSGSGKSTIVNALMEQIPNLSFSVSATNRKPRGEEVDGIHYLFLSDAEFRNKIEREDFIEWEEVYPGRYYGSLKAEVEKKRLEGKHVVFDIDVVGGVNLKKQFGNEALALFIKVPSLEILEQRLRARATDSEEDIQTRLAKAHEELEYSSQFDRVVVNEHLNDCIRESRVIIEEFLAT